MIEKIKNDSISFYQFKELGNLKCHDKLSSTNKFEDYYYKIYNQFYPLPRIYSMQNMEVLFDFYIDSEWAAKNEKNCENLKFHKTDFHDFINDVENMNTPTELNSSDEEIISNKEKFLHNYFIKVESD